NYDGKFRVFIVKHNKNGELLWLKEFIGHQFFSHSFDIDNLGNIFISGAIGGTTDFNPGFGNAIINITFDGKIEAAAYLVKLNPDGNFIWLKSIDVKIGSKSGL